MCNTQYVERRNLNLNPYLKPKPRIGVLLLRRAHDRHCARAPAPQDSEARCHVLLRRKKRAVKRAVCTPRRADSDG